MLEGRVAFVTGSTRGIGWECARLFARHGARVFLNGRSDSDLLAQRTTELEETGAEVDAIPGDMGDPAVVAAAYQQIFKSCKRLDVLVNNAGVLQDALLGMIPADSVRETFAANTFATLHNMQEAARLMGRNRSGSIVNVASIIGRVGNEGQTVYGASKAAVIGMTLSAAKELAPKNIRVNAVAPGFIETDMTRSLTPEKFAERVASIKMGRIGRPEDVANAILFLASDQSSYITGQVIGVDGGMLI